MAHRHDHPHHHYVRYPVTLFERLYSIFIGPLAVLAILFIAYAIYPVLAPPVGASVSLSAVIEASLATFTRLSIAYVLAVVVAVPLALAVTTNRTIEAILLPVFDVLQSVPILALFPVIIFVFVRYGDLNGAAVFIIFLTMLWNIVFTLIGGLKIIPNDILYAAEVFGVRGFARVRRIILPAIVPQLVTGSILAAAQGWNITIVAEVLHTYIPGGTTAQDVFGVGSVLVHAAANAQNDVFLTTVVVMIAFIAFLNFFVWQRLLHFAQRFRFE